MNHKRRRAKRQRATQEEIDEKVVAQANDDSAWGPIVKVTRKQTAIGLPGNLAPDRPLSSLRGFAKGIRTDHVRDKKDRV